MKKYLGIICTIRGKILSWWYGIETEGHFYKEYIENHYICKLCGDKTKSLKANKK